MSPEARTICDRIRADARKYIGDFERALQGRRRKRRDWLAEYIAGHCGTGWPTEH